jgi:hypothetical protein
LQREGHFLAISDAPETTTSKRIIVFMGNSGSLAARNLRIILDEIGCSSALIHTVLQENHTSNLSEDEIPKTAKTGAERRVIIPCLEINGRSYTP